MSRSLPGAPGAARGRHRRPPGGDDPRPAAAPDRGAERAGDGAAAAGRRAQRRASASSSSAPSTPPPPSAPASSAPSGWPSRRSPPRRWRRRSSPPRSSTTAPTPGSRCCAASPSCRCCRSPATGGRASSRSGRPTPPAAWSRRSPAGRRGRATSWPGRRRSPTTRCPTWSAASPAGRGRSSTCRCRWSASGLIAIRSLFGEAVFATWEEAELMEVSMISERGTADAEALGSRAEKDGRCSGGDLDGAGAPRRPGAVARCLRWRPALGDDPGAARSRTSSSASATAARPPSSTNSPTLLGQAPGAAADLPPLGQQPQRGLRTLARNRDAADPDISTADDQTLAELITPAADRARRPATTTCCSSTTSSPNAGCRAYIRPLGEPNRCLNAWSAVNCDGSQKGGEHTTGWYKQAFRRIAAIVRGGQTLEGINATLAEIGLPPLNRTKGPNPTEPAGGPGEHDLEPAARRLAAGQRQLPRQLLARQPLGRLGRHRLLLRISGLERPQPLLRRQAVEGQADRDHRVGGLTATTNRASSNS